MILVICMCYSWVEALNFDLDAAFDKVSELMEYGGNHVKACVESNELSRWIFKGRMEEAVKTLSA